MRTLSKGDNGSGITRQMLDQITEDADSNFAELQASITESQKQPYSPALTELTLSELSALVTAGTLIRGRQYYVTDKKWLLIAMDDSTLKPVSGRLLITNGDTLPTGIEPDVLLIDTGVIDTDISVETGTPVSISIPSGYIYSSAVFYGTAGSGNTYNIISTIGVIAACIDNEACYKLFSPTTDMELGDSTSLTLSTSAGETNEKQAVLEFHRSEL